MSVHGIPQKLSSRRLAEELNLKKAIMPRMMECKSLKIEMIMPNE